MARASRFFVLPLFSLLLIARVAAAADQPAVALPAGVQAVWDLAKAHRQFTPTREQVCINGLWQWQPATDQKDKPPEANWGYFKVPGCWPGITDYMQKDFQTVFTHPAWKDQRLGGITSAWYQREITIPESWSGRRIALSAEYLNSLATAYLDGQKIGDLRFPAGELDLSAHVRPGNTHLLSLHVTALPLKGVLLSYTDSASARQMQGRVARRGLCGDVLLVSTPPRARLGDLKVATSVRKGEITFDAALLDLDPTFQYSLSAHVTAAGKEIKTFPSQPFTSRDLKEGRLIFTHSWKLENLWDLHTPQNQLDVVLTLNDAASRTLDASFPSRFAFREFWIDGRDFYLNGSRIFLSAVPFDNGQVGAALASYAGAKESFERLKSIGVNFVYTHNYGCQPGDHLSFAEILRAADDVGMLVALSQPHFSHYDWQAAHADTANGYARHADFYVKVAGNHPSAIAYSMSHNACGYSEDMNPDMIDGTSDPRGEREKTNVRRALRAEAIVNRLDPPRVVYHHAGGNIGAMHTANFYPNFVPVQELSDWFEHWATKGVKPAFTCEYGAPFSWDWAMYRGWYKGERSFGSARVPWELCLGEWNAQFIGDRAFSPSEPELANLRWEAKQFAAGKVWNRWDYPYDLNSKAFDERYPIIADYLTRNWRAFRTWGLSAISAWEHGQYWKLKPGVDRGRRDLPVDWENLQRPGYSPDYLAQRYERMDLAYDRDDWEPTEAAAALLQSNGPLLAYIAGGPENFTNQDHNYLPGETVRKQIVVINNSRQTVTCKCICILHLNAPIGDQQQVTVRTGEQERIPWDVKLSDSMPPGELSMEMIAGFQPGQEQNDSFTINILPRPKPLQISAKIALFDPKGETAAWLKKQNVPFQEVGPTANLAGFDLLIVGKSALSLSGAAPDISRVQSGLRVLLFEQSAEVLEKRFGFRVAEYGLRQVFPRVPDHPALESLAAEHLANWRGEATLQPPRLSYQLRPMYGPTVQWCGIQVPHLWRCGNRGNVASVLIEKPARGDFLPILDGGFGLQYSPLLEYREGQGLMLFCQLDVTARTESDPAAETITRNLVRYAANWQPRSPRQAVYLGDAAGRQHLESCGFNLPAYDGRPLGADRVLVVGSGAAAFLKQFAAPLTDFWKAGGRMVGIGLSESELSSLPLPVTSAKAEYISTYFSRPPADSVFAGIGPADASNRDPRELSLIASGAARLDKSGLLAHDEMSRLVLCQLAPWQFANNQQPNFRKTFRRSSFLVTRLVSNLGVESQTPLLTRFHVPPADGAQEKRWERGLYLDQPEEWDDPYRFFRW